MRVAVIYRTREMPPQEMLPMLTAAMGQWLEKYGKRFSTLEFFVTGGGLGVIDIDDSAELHRIAAEHPFTPYSDIEVKPVVEPGVAMAIFGEVLAAFAAGMQASG